MENEKKVNGIDLKIPKKKNQISIIEVSKHVNKSDSELKGWNRYIFVFKQVWVQLLNLILIYFVSLSIFPSLQANIKPLNHIISDGYFVPVFCFLLFPTFQAVGNFLAQKIRRPGPNYITIFAFLRFLFIPLFLICNYNPNERQWPVIIQNDWIYIIIAISMALSSGYLSSLSFMYCPQCVEPEFSSTAGMMASLTKTLGILAGINSSLLYPMLIML
jgi:equilibrative nucleoside transporter 1/2/3